MTGLLALLLAAVPPPAPSNAGIELRSSGASKGTVRAINCTGGAICSADAGFGTLWIDAGTVAPVNATYITQTCNASLTAEQCLSANGTGIMISTTGTGVVSTYAGASCAATQYVSGISAAGALTCSAVAPVGAQYWTGAADSTLTAEKNLGALATGLVINTAGVPSAYTAQTCTNSFVKTISASGTVGCVTVTLTSDVGGTLPEGNGGTGAGALTCSSGACLTSNGSAYSCTSTITASDVACSGTCVSDAEISAVAGSKVSGAVATATALASNPTDCSAGQYANAIAASGDLTCAQVQASELGGQITLAGGNQVKDILPVANGGTGVSALPNCGTNQVLTANGSAFSCKTLCCTY